MRASVSTFPRATEIAPVIPLVLPMAAFMALTSLEAVTSGSSLYPLAYSIKILAVTAVLAYCWSALPMYDGRGVREGLLAGIAGFALWIGLWYSGIDGMVTQFLPEIIRPGERSGFNPFDGISAPLGMGLFVAVRLTGLVLVVPLIEEFFWRTFLWRYLVSERFEQVAPGTFTWLSFLGTTAAFAVVHPEFVTAAVWGAGVGLLYIWTKNVWACIAMHASTNLLLGLYVITTGTWVLW